MTVTRPARYDLLVLLAIPWLTLLARGDLSLFPLYSWLLGPALAAIGFALGRASLPGPLSRVAASETAHLAGALGVVGLATAVIFTLMLDERGDFARHVASLRPAALGGWTLLILWSGRTVAAN